jgi:enoyl-CoA hydratase
MNFENLIISVENKIAIVTLNRPNKLNALNKSTLEELHIAFTQFEQDDLVQAIILTGSGDKAFVAGADISEFAHFSPVEGTKLAAEGHEKVFNLIENLTKPVIAAIHGYVLGGGLELALACHFRIASDNAKIGFPEVTLGLIPGYGGTQRLPRLIGKGRAMEMILTASTIPANVAREYGLVNHVVPKSGLIEFSIGIAEKITKNAPIAISEAILAINASFDRSKNGYEEEINAFGRLFGTADFKEGTAAFLEKRKANFNGK